MENTVNQENGTVGTGPEPQGERTFTQSELNAIVTDRLSRAQEKYKDYEALKEKAAQFDAAQEAGKTELQKANEKAEALQKQVDAYTKAETLRSVRKKVSEATGVPEELLYGEDEETCNAQAQTILKYMKPGESGTVVKDGGEVIHKNGAGSTRDQFADWFRQATK